MNPEPCLEKMELQKRFAPEKNQESISNDQQ